MARDNREGRSTVLFRAGRMERIGPAVGVPSAFTWRWQRADDHAVELDITVTRGKATLEAVRVLREPSRPGISSADVKRLPVASLVETALAAASFMHLRRNADGSNRFAPSNERNRGDVEAAARSATTRRRVTDQRVREAANTYSRLKALGGTVDDAASELYLSRPQMFRLLKLAREAGYLPERGSR